MGEGPIGGWEMGLEGSAEEGGAGERLEGFGEGEEHCGEVVGGEGLESAGRSRGRGGGGDAMAVGVLRWKGGLLALDGMVLGLVQWIDK